MNKILTLEDLSIGDKFKTRSGSAIYEVIGGTQTIDGIPGRMVRVYFCSDVYEREMFPYVTVSKLVTDESR